MDITLSDYYTNYEYLEIYCKETWGDTHFSMKINVSTDNYFSLSTNVSRSGINSFMSIAKTYYLSGGQTIYKSPYGTFIGIYFNKYQNTYEYHEGYDILITKVVGYK